ncbi:MAG: substrate-binding domain-containing protein [Clostridia bacterium]|nr:substrate-binding domain-containing protein [Clostridia bacterium]MBQ7296667.1 substrate-binding domain-containing protein [Clostridia bacterium]
MGGFMLEDDINRYIANRGTGAADRTGSWSSINQDVARGENWQQIVTDSPFKLGQITPVTEDGYTNNYCDKGTYPHIDGSTVCVPMAVEFARQHLGFEDRTANQFVQFSTTHYAYEHLIRKEYTNENYVHYNFDAFINMSNVDLVIATEPSDEELTLADNWGITLIKEPVCYDAFVFITHKDNPVESLTVEQIKKIYTGEITNWKDVGGKNEKIRAFQREKNSGSQTAMENLVMGGADMIDPIEVKIIVGMGELVDAVAEYENETASIGYTYRYYIDTLYKNDSIKTISVNGIAPTDENIRNESYPFTTNYYGVIRQDDEDKIGGQFLNWMLSDEGQQCIAQAGYIALR